FGLDRAGPGFVGGDLFFELLSPLDECRPLVAGGFGNPAGDLFLLVPQGIAGRDDLPPLLPQFDQPGDVARDAPPAAVFLDALAAVTDELEIEHGVVSCQ